MTPRQLEIRDDVLQVLFWKEGEKLGEEVGRRELVMWLGVESGDLQPVLDWMLRDGLLLAAGGSEDAVRLSDEGRVEGGRRFTESFADLGLGAQGHGECAPGCDCLELGPEHCTHHHHEHPADGAP